MAGSSSSCSGVEYNLRCSLLGHTSDVRAICVTHTGGILTASRDNTARLWTPDPDSR